MLKSGWSALALIAVAVLAISLFRATDPQNINPTEPSSAMPISGTLASAALITIPNDAPPAWRDRAKESAVPSKWTYSEHPDEMRHATTYFACLQSDNRLDFDFPYNGGSYGELCLRSSPAHGKDVILQIVKGQFVCGVFSCPVKMKFDENKIISFSAAEPADGTNGYLFIRGYKRFLSKIGKSKKLVIEADYYDEGLKQLEFTSSGLTWSH